jgi:hypothetical protein
MVRQPLWTKGLADKERQWRAARRKVLSPCRNARLGQLAVAMQAAHFTSIFLGSVWDNLPSLQSDNIYIISVFLHKGPGCLACWISGSRPKLTFQKNKMNTAWLCCWLPRIIPFAEHVPRPWLRHFYQNIRLGNLELGSISPECYYVLMRLPFVFAVSSLLVYEVNVFFFTPSFRDVSDITFVTRSGLHWPHHKRP